MNYQVFYYTRWLKDLRFCGDFQTLCAANDHVKYLQHNLPNGKNLKFNITT